MSYILKSLIGRFNVIPLGARGIVRQTEKGKGRYLIYLDQGMNHIWRELHKRRIKVYVYIEIPEEEPASAAQKKRP